MSKTLEELAVGTPFDGLFDGNDIKPVPTKGVVDAELKNFRSGNPSMKLGLSIGTQEELRTTLISISKRRLPFIGEEGAYDEYSFRLEDLQALLKAQLTAERDRLLAALDELKQPQVEGNKAPYINRGYIEGEVNGHNKALDTVKKLIQGGTV